MAAGTVVRLESCTIVDRTFCLVANSKSGSYDAALADRLLTRAAELGLGTPQLRLIGEQGCPSREMFRGEDIVAVLGGDGTVGSVVRALGGWDGAVLVLPGGTMNIASKRLHGEADAEPILEAVGHGRARRIRPTTILLGEVCSLAGVMLGPGTSWNEVREALREFDLAAIGASTVRAFATTSTGARIACTHPPLGRAEGYPMIEALPTAQGMVLNAYHADDAGEFAVQLAGLLMRDFRNGPHEAFESRDPVTIAALDGEPMGVLCDGEPVPSAAKVTLAVGVTDVDLLATRVDE